MSLPRIERKGLNLRKFMASDSVGGNSVVPAMLHPRRVFERSTTVYSTMIQAEQIQTNSNHSSFSSSDGPCIVESEID